MKIAIFKGKGIIAPYVIDGFIQGFRLLSHEVFEINVQQGYNLEQHTELLNIRPDFCVSYGLVGCIEDQDGQYLLRRLGIPLVCLHFDNVFFSLSPEIVEEFKHYEEFYYHFVWDKRILDFFKQYGVKQAFPIMLGTDPNIFKPESNISSFDSSVAFVGSINSANSIRSNDQRIDRFVDFIIANKMQNIHVPVSELCLEAFNEKQFQIIRDLYIENPLAFWKGVYYFIHAKGSIVMRQFLLEAIGGVDVHVYGANPWKGNGMIFHDRVSYSQLSRVYQSHPINLNITSLQLETSVNNRVFDVFASQAFVLSDYREDMKIIFPNHWEQITYKNPEELGEKGEYFLTHPKERKELVNDLYHEVLNKHTYKHRASDIIETISSHINTLKQQDLLPLEENKYKKMDSRCPLCDGDTFNKLYSIQGHDDFLAELYRCTDCCVVFMNPMPTDEYLASFYNSVYYSKQHRQKMGWDVDLNNVSIGVLQANEKRMDLVEKFLDSSLRYPKGRLLDVGCSTGIFLFEAKQRYWDVQGIEISDQAASRGRINYGLNVITGELTENAFEADVFDVVTAWDVLEHIPNPKEFMGCVKKILKPGGLFVLNTPNVSSTIGYFQGDTWRHLDPPLHVVLYDHISIGILLKMYGFEILRISSGNEYMGQMQVVAKKL